MQKIHFYLVPNRIIVTTDLVGNLSTEFTKVYQRTIKLYKGIDNTIELEVRNPDQRKVNVAGKTAMLKFFDVNHALLFTVTGVSTPTTLGRIIVTIPKAEIAEMEPQMVTMAAVLMNGTTESILYSDTQFDIFSTVEIFNGYNDTSSTMKEELTVFNFEYDRKEYVSEIGNFGSPLNCDHKEHPNRSVTFEYEGPYQGIIYIDVTRDKSTAFGTTWTEIASWDTRIDETKSLTGDWRFVRFRHGGTGPGLGAKFNITKINGEYTLVSVIHRGRDYRVGDELVILGSLLDGDDGVNDLTITVNSINAYPPGSINSVSGITWSGDASDGNGYYRNVSADNLVSSKAIDKIIIRH